MFTFAADFWRSKTTYATLGGIATAVGMGLNHQMTWIAVGQTALVALLALFHRDAVQKGNEQGARERAQLKDIAKAAQPVATDLQTILAAYSAAHHSTVAATVAAVIGELNRIGGQAYPAEQISGTAMPTEPTMADHVLKDAVNDAGHVHIDTSNEPADGEADAK